MKIRHSCGVRFAGVMCSLLFLGVSASACGSSASQARTRVSNDPSARSLTGTFATLAASGDAKEGSVVQSASEGGSPRTTVTRLTDGRTTTIPGDVPLYAVTTWSTPEDVGVLGARCPTWKSGDAPAWEDHSEKNVETLCGSTKYEVWMVDRSTGEATQIHPTGLTAGNGYVVAAVAGPTVLLMAQGQGAGPLVLDTKTARVAPLPADPDTAGSAEAVFKACLDSQGNPFGVLAWTGQAPPPVTANGWESQVARAGDGSSLVVVTPSTAGTWNPIATAGKLSSFQGVTGCSSSGMWRIGPSGGGQVDLTSGVAQLTPVPAVPVEATRTSQVSIHSLLGSGPPLAAVQPAPTAASPDAPRTTSGYLWVGGKWDTTPTVSLGSGSSPFLNGGQVAATRLQSGTGQLKVVLK